MFGIFKTFKEGKIIETAYKNALFVIMANYLENICTEHLAYAATFYSLGLIPPNEGMGKLFCKYIDDNKNLVEETIKSLIENDPSFYDLIAATTCITYGHLRAHGQVVEAERVRKSLGSSLQVRTEHLSANGYKSLVDNWGKRMGFIK